MLRCSTWKCDNPPIKQCNTCNRLLLCRNCSWHHCSNHLQNKALHNLSNIEIKLSKGQLIRLRNNIKEPLIMIESQKKNIVNEAFNISIQISNMVKQAHSELDQMIKDYNKIYNKIVFEIKDLEKVQAIIKNKLAFEYPSFSKISVSD